MKKLIALLLILLCYGQAFAGLSAGVVGCSPPAVGSSCAIYEQNSGSAIDNYDIGTYSGNYYRGVQAWTPADAGKSVCKIYARFTAVGTISGKSYYAELWTHDGTNLTAKVGSTSDAVTGSNSWSASWVEFNFSSPVSVSNATAYCLVIYTTGGVDGSNFVVWNAAGGGEFQGVSSKFNSSGTRIDFSNYDMLIRVYVQ